MRVRRSTVIFLIVLIGVSGFAYYEYQKSLQEVLSDESAQRLSSMKTSEVTKVEFKKGEESWVVEKVDNQWRLVSPVNDLAKKSAVESFVGSILALRLRPLGEIKNEHEVGLDTPLATFRFYGAHPLTVEVGSVNAFDGSFYVRRGGEVLLGDTSWSHLLNRKADSMRDKSLVRKRGNLKSFELVKRNKTVLKLEKNESSWQMPSRDQPLDLNQVQEYVQTLLTLEADQVVSEKSANRPSLDLNQPDWHLKLNFNGEAKPLEMFVTKDDGDFVNLALSSRDLVYRLAMKKWKQLDRTTQDFIKGTDNDNPSEKPDKG